MDHRYIAVEGVIGVGKTTLCRALAARLGALDPESSAFARARRRLDAAVFQVYGLSEDEASHMAAAMAGT